MSGRCSDHARGGLLAARVLSSHGDLIVLRPWTRHLNMTTLVDHGSHPRADWTIVPRIRAFHPPRTWQTGYVHRMYPPCDVSQQVINASTTATASCLRWAPAPGASVERTPKKTESHFQVRCINAINHPPWRLVLGIGCNYGSSVQAR